MSNTHAFVVKNGLEVGTSITATGQLTTAGQTFPASDGSTGQYLTTNGSGALSWGTVTTSFNITDGTTTDSVGGGETVTFTGGTNITLAVTDNTVTINNDVIDSGDITESGNLFFTDTRAVDAVEGHAHLTIDGGTLYVDTSNNYVGIGDTSPSGKLDVAGNIMINGSEVINASGTIVGAVADSAMTIGGSLAGVLSNTKMQYANAYSGTPIQGSFFFDSLNAKLKVYTGSAFVDAVPASGGGGGGSTDANSTFRDYSFTLTGTVSSITGVDDHELTAGAFVIGHKYTITAAGNTSFTGIGAANNNVGTVFVATGAGSGTGTAKQTLFYNTANNTSVAVYVNGVKQVYGSGRDFVATTGTSVNFTYNLGAGDTVDVQVYELLTNSAYYVKSEVYTKAETNTQVSTALPLAGGTMTGNIVSGDNVKATYGTGADLEIYHDGSNSYIKDTGTGALVLNTSQLYINNPASNEFLLTATENGGVTLYHDNAAKLATTATGVAVTGDITVSGTVDGRDVAADGATADAALPKAGGTMTGNLQVNTTATTVPTYSSYRAQTTVSAVGQLVGTTYVLNGSISRPRAGIYARAELANGYGAGLIFMTRSAEDGSTLATTDERMRIDSSGNVLIDCATTPSASVHGWMKLAGGGGYVKSAVGGSGGYTHYQFINTNGTVGQIYTSGSSTTYATSSDYRLKENVTPMSEATAQTKLLKPCNFDWIVGGNTNGFLAHELAEVVPEAVTGTKDAMRDEEYEVTPATDTEAAVMGTRSVPDMQGIDQSKLVPLLTATIQELIARIEALENN